MSLQVWLPLNGDLHNLGLSNITVTNNGATVDNNGKIGKCYSFNGSNSVIYNRNIFINCNKLSMCCWIYRTTSHTGDGYISSLNNGAGYADAAIALDSPSSTSVCFIGGGNYSLKATISPNTWNHIAVTYDGVKVIGYLNGQKVGEVANTQILTRTLLAIGCRCNSTDSFIYYFPGKLNDFRLYDHALSAKEVEEIAKGLVLHYKLDDIYSESTTNLCAGLVKGGRTNIVDNTVIHTGENADTYWYIKPKEALIGGATYTVSCYLSGFTLDTDWILWGVGALSGNNNAGHWKTYNGYNSFTFTMPAGKDGSTANFIFDDSNPGTGRSLVFTISNVLLELKDHATPFIEYGLSRAGSIIYDASGYSNNGTIVGSLETVVPSPRYNCATKFDGASYIKKTDFIYDSNIWSISLWYLKPTNPTAYECLFCFSQGNGGDSNKKIAACPNSGRIWYKGESGSSSISLLKINEWTNLIMTCNGTTVTIYLNGNSIGTFSASTALTGRTDLVIGARASAENATNIAVLYTGNLSDFRIYATALTEALVKELYNTSMSIDNNGNIHARELVEL